MLKNTIWFALSTALLATTAFAQGEGEGEGEVAEPCGDVTIEGSCDGDVAVFCGANETLARIDCANFAFGDGQTQSGTCEFYPNWGSWCAFADGDACAFSLTGGGRQVYACSTPTSGCFDAVCTANKGVCTPDEGGGTPQDPSDDTPPVCSDNLLASCTPWSQRSEELDCNGQVDQAGTLLGGTCEDGVCTDVEVGLPCIDGIIECASGATCVGATAQAPGECTGGGGEGEGEGEGNGNGNGGGGDDPPEEDPPACSGNHPARGTPAAFAAAAVALAVVVRRRRR